VAAVALTMRRLAGVVPMALAAAAASAAAVAPASARDSTPALASDSTPAALQAGAGSDRAAAPALLAAPAPPTAPGAGLPSFEAVRAAHRASDRQLLDRHGMPLQTVRVDPHGRRLAWVPLHDVSPALLEAIVLSEDRRFWEHSGVDWRALAASAWANAWNRRTRGASTLTMQLAGLLDPGLERPSGGRRLDQKAGQAWTALQLERRWTKAEVLEAYLNLVPWRGETVGLDAMVQTLFGKLAHGLDRHEAAIAAVLLRAPNADAQVVARRACALLREQQEPCDGVSALAAGALARPGGMPIGPQLAPHAAREALRQERDRARAESRPPGNGPLVTTLDAGLQAMARAALRRQLAELAGRQVRDGAVVVLDNASGEVLAWVGSAGDLASSQVDGVLAQRQPGSTLKPFVYALAIERRLITAATLLADEPAQIATHSGLYGPQNYERDFKGWVSARTALGSSLNLPAVRVGRLVGVEALHTRLNDLGLGLEQPPGHYGAALALGSADVSLLALANAYRALAVGGRWSPARLVPGSSPPPRRVFDAAAAAIVVDILADDAARAATFGLGSVLATRGFAAVKTGTSKDLRDNWCVGFTDRYTVGVWVGNAGGEPMQRVSGVSGAAPVWAEVVAAMHAGAVSRRPEPPPALQRGPAAFDGRVARHDARRIEWFMPGTRPATSGGDGTRWTRVGIAKPADGSIVALDPDVPWERQRLRFEGEPGEWRLNGERLGTGASLDWTPRPGRHELRLVDASGQVLQAVRFEVRLPPLRARGSPQRREEPATPHRERLNSRSSAASMTRPQTL
jgi:penicillin-binding protein 1C